MKPIEFRIADEIQLSEPEMARILKDAEGTDADIVSVVPDGPDGLDGLAVTYLRSVPKFERIRRITGYLTGTLDTWNDAKKAEEKDRVKHGLEEKEA